MFPGQDWSLTPSYMPKSLLDKMLYSSSGKPWCGQLYIVVCWSRNKYHYAIRKLRKIQHRDRAQELLEASYRGDIQLLAAMKEVKGKFKGQIMPTCIEG